MRVTRNILVAWGGPATHAVPAPWARSFVDAVASRRGRNVAEPPLPGPIRAREWLEENRTEEDAWRLVTRPAYVVLSAVYGADAELDVGTLKALVDSQRARAAADVPGLTVERAQGRAGGAPGRRPSARRRPTPPAAARAEVADELVLLLELALEVREPPRRRQLRLEAVLGVAQPRREPLDLVVLGLGLAPRRRAELLPQAPHLVGQIGLVARRLLRPVWKSCTLSRRPPRQFSTRRLLDDTLVDFHTGSDWAWSRLKSFWSVLLSATRRSFVLSRAFCSSFDVKSSKLAEGPFGSAGLNDPPVSLRASTCLSKASSSITDVSTRNRTPRCCAVASRFFSNSTFMFTIFFRSLSRPHP